MELSKEEKRRLLLEERKLEYCGLLEFFLKQKNYKEARRRLISLRSRAHESVEYPPFSKLCYRCEFSERFNPYRKDERRRDPFSMRYRCSIADELISILDDVKNVG